MLDAAAEASSAVPAIEPRVVPDGNGMRIVLPGDPAYERAPVADPEDGGSLGDFNEAVRAVSMQAEHGGTRRRTGAPARTPIAGIPIAGIPIAGIPIERMTLPAVPDFGLGPRPARAGWTRWRPACAGSPHRIRG